MNRALGRRPPKNAPALRLAPLLTGVAPDHPASADHLSQVNSWCLGQNNRFSTCGPTSVANYCKLVYANLAVEQVTVTDAAIFDLYRRSGNPHFDPATDTDDNGVDMQTMLEAWATGGIVVGRTDGSFELVEPVAFTKVDIGSLDELRAAEAIFGGLLLGVDLRQAQKQQTDLRPPVWDYARAADWGGHAIVSGRYTSAITGVDLSSVSWAEIVGMTDAFVAHQLGEAWVAILPLHFQHPAFLQGVDVTALATAYRTITGRVLPVPTPIGPTPNAAAVTLNAALGNWPDAHHIGRNAQIAHALQTWRISEGF